MAAATARLSSSTLSLMARSARLRGLTWTTSIRSAGMTHGSPARWPLMYSSTSLCRPAGEENSSEMASTLTITDGFQLLAKNALVVLADCLRFLSTSLSWSRTPRPIHGRRSSGRRIKWST